MKAEKTGIEGLIVIEPRIFEDDRGEFHESFNKRFFDESVGETAFVQDNLSVSKVNVLRGLHFQVPPFAQAKLVSVPQGRVLDVAVDLRKNSITYGKTYWTELSASNRRQLFVPRGFAHGFVALENGTVFSYKCDNYYSKDHEASICWNDPDLDIDWGIDDPVLSEKDALAPSFAQFESPF